MTNIDTQIIYDKNGNPIPQYLDVSDKTGGSAGTMKPITGQNGAQFTQVTGSIVELFSISNATITPGSVYNVLSSVDVTNYKEIIVHGNNIGNLEARFLGRIKGSHNLTNVIVETNFPAHYKVISSLLLATVRNSGTSDVTTNLVCTGVR